MTKLFKAAFLLTTMSIASVDAFADSSDGEALIGKSWEEITSMAKGGEVNWFMWGGSDTINQYVTEYVGGILKNEYDIELNRVGISDTAEAVNIVLSEKEAGVVDKGSVDMIWVNGENFRTMKQGGLAYCGYTDTLPNNKLVNWDNPAIAIDFGVPVDGCEVPWSKVQFSFAHNAATIENPPRSIGELIEWVKENPGQFSYPAPPDFNGAVFVRHVFYHAAGGVEQLFGDFDQEKFDEVATKTWKILLDMKPYLWREGQTYPASISALDQLYANSEVALTFNYEPADVGIKIENGTFPPTTQGYGLTDGTIGNTNYTVIPFNSPNKAAALVLQNVLLSGEVQLQKAMPDVWGAAPAIEISRTSEEVRKKFAAIERHPNVVPAEDLAKFALPELQVSWISAIEKGWIENVGSK
ncbi:ABC transporter substrate-binding protein [Lentilitoribacter sp. EG35]|uniref:ABC transporter substrate-binding protein n=1 Tax=Lentilitoribacter sp. EG35 TaxID=3234192 RepID=UPI00345FCE98